MAQRQLPCDSNGVCMLCKLTPPVEETLTCITCATPWHIPCLSSPLETLDSEFQWECPDCTNAGGDAPAGENSGSGDLVAAIRAIEADESLTEQQKAERKQELLSGHVEVDVDVEEGGNELLDVFGEDLKCSFCILLPERPVTTPCGHNFCLECFERWIAQGNRTCAKCRQDIPSKMAPRVNSALVAAIRLAKMSSKPTTSRNPQSVSPYVHNQDRPEVAFTTERAKRSGLSNAASGRIFVTIPEYHFGPILPEHDPERNQGVLVGECWNNRLEVRQWGVHFPHVSGIAGQVGRGAQSVVLSGGYEDDEDHGDWFLYTGSGGRDLSGNKRTNKLQTFDQTFEKYNESLRLSCLKGYPVRVIRSCKAKNSAYAPEKGLRYDGIYRVEICWRKVGIQGFKVCRFLFVRCDNAPAPWTSDEHGDEPRFTPEVAELEEEEEEEEEAEAEAKAKAIDISTRTESPAWDYDREERCWMWKSEPPLGKGKRVTTEVTPGGKKGRRPTKEANNTSLRAALLEEFSCLLCDKVLSLPVTTPCGHNFCKSCLQENFSGQSFTLERTRGGRALRTLKNVMCCPECSHDITDILRNPQVNREMMGAIEKLEQLAASEEQQEQMEPTAQAEADENVEPRDQEDAGLNPSIAQKRKKGESSDRLMNAEDDQPEKKPRRGRPKGGSKAVSCVLDS